MAIQKNPVELLRSSAPYRYSLEDLENMERKAKMEDNTENQLHALMDKTVSKKSSMPVLGGRMAVTGGLLGQGQKEEAYDIPATSVRRPVFARTITTQPEEKVSTNRAFLSTPALSLTIYQLKPMSA